MPRLQSHQPHHSSQLHPSSSKTKLHQTTKPNKTSKLPSTPKKTSATTPLRSSTPTPLQRLKPTKSKKNNHATPSSKTHEPPILLSFYERLNNDLYSKPSSARKSKKQSSNRHALILPHSSDNDEVHSIYLPFTNHSSRSTTPTPTKASRLNPFDHPDEPFILPLHAFFPPSPSAEHTQSPPLSLLTASTQSLPPPRRHARAKSAASIFEVGKSTSTVGAQLKGVKDDWDMPTDTRSRDIIKHHKGKKLPLQTSSSANNHLTPSLVQHDPIKSINRPQVAHPSKEVTPTRQQKSTLARTSSAGTIKRFLPPSEKLTKPEPSHSRSEDESALTWQQSIIRPLPKLKTLPVTPDSSLIPSETKSGCHKKTLATTGGYKTPVKPSPAARKMVAQSAVKPKLTSLSPPSKRRNSLSSGHTFHFQKQPDITSDQGEFIDSLIGSKAGRDALSWQSFPSSATVHHHPGLPPLHSNPLPIVGAQAESIPPRRHTKSYTHQPAMLSNRRPIHPTSNQNTILAPPSSNIPESNHQKMMTTPSKSRSTSEDLNLASPDKQLTSPALRAAFMYAGPQFHNSPCPAALPAPKFSFGSA